MTPPAPHEADAEVAVLIGLIDRLEALLQRSALAELEVEAGGTTLRLSKPSALAPAAWDPAQQRVDVAAAADGAAGPGPGRRASDAGTAHGGLRPVLAPLTGVFYTSPSPGSAPYVREGGEVNAGQVIGLIEAMKLFNEIKSDVTGIVRRIAAEGGALVKARQVLIEVEPS